MQVLYKFKSRVGSAMVVASSAKASITPGCDRWQLLGKRCLSETRMSLNIHEGSQ